MAMQNPPGWLQNAGSTHTAAQLRMYTSALIAGNFSGSSFLRPRGGVHPSQGLELVVTQTGSPSMAVLVDTGSATIPGTLSATQGGYYVVNDAQVTLSVTAAHATLPRIDIVVINVRDAFYSGANNDVQLQVVAGTPASSPVAPTAPDNSITLANIAVGAAVTTITNADITDQRFYMAALGGVINARTDATRPGSTVIVEGQQVWSMDVNKLYVWDGSAYNQMYPGHNKLAESILGSTAASVTFSSIPSTYKQLWLQILARGDSAAQFVGVRLRFNNDSTAIYDNLQIYGSGASATAGAGETLNETSINLGDMPGANCIAGSCAIFDVSLPFYNDSTFWQASRSEKTLMSQTSGGQANQLWRKCWAGRWRNTAAVTRLDIISGAGNFIAGSSFTLYGLA